MPFPNPYQLTATFPVTSSIKVFFISVKSSPYSLTKNSTPIEFNTFSIKSKCFIKNKNVSNFYVKLLES